MYHDWLGDLVPGAALVSICDNLRGGEPVGGNYPSKVLMQALMPGRYMSLFIGNPLAIRYICWALGEKHRSAWRVLKRQPIVPSSHNGSRVFSAVGRFGGTDLRFVYFE